MHLASFGPLVSVPVVYAPCIDVPKVGSDRLEPHHDRLWPSRSKPTFRPGQTAHNRLCAVRPVFCTLRKYMNRLRFRFDPKREKNRTEPDLQTLIPVKKSGKCPAAWQAYQKI